jgi:hypothetical protein
MANAGWTIAPLLTSGWLILGAISSPLLHQTLIKEKKELVEVKNEPVLGENRS